MSTFGAVKTAIARRLLDENNTAVTDVEIGEAINEAIKKWKVKRFFFNVSDQPLTIATDDTLLTLPTDFLAPIPKNAVTVVYNGLTYKLDKTSPTLFDAISSTSVNGRPENYLFRDGQIEIQPMANQAYDGTIYYIKDYNDFVTDGSQDTLTNDFLTNGEMLIRAEALAQIHGELRQDEKMEMRYTNRALSEYNTLRTRTALLNRTGTLTVEQ